MMSHRLPDEGERFAAFALCCSQGLRRSGLRELRERHGSLELALPAVAGAREAGLKGLENLRKNDAWVLLPEDPGWPALLRRTKPPVEMLYVRGSWDLSKPAVAVVGSRHATPYGLSFASELSAALAADGYSIVSGGALGIDGAVHRGALATGQTVVVLGGGLDRPYPSQHRSLFNAVLEAGGALVSEAPFGTEARAQLFPRRNRIIAALGRAVVVVQAARGSGSLITARLACELALPVFAVPGAPGDAVAEGTKDLLRSGARLCLGPEEVRAELGLGETKVTDASPRRPSARAGRDPVLSRLEHVIGVSPRPLDDLAQAAGLSAQRTAVAMTRLELLGLAVRAPGGGYFRHPPTAGNESPQRSDGFRNKDAQ